jgi:mercuric ion transport protein
MAMRRTVVGWCFAVTSFLACPCHLVVTLPLAAALLGGTALGGWIAAHEGAIAVGATIYFIGGLTAAGMLLLARSGAATSGLARVPGTALRAMAGEPKGDDGLVC